MDWQQILSLAIVALTAALLARHGIRKRRRLKNSLCGHDCGCSPVALENLRREAAMRQQAR